jgi:tetratricopeptide (TPR) repeat protein
MAASLVATIMVFFVSSRYRLSLVPFVMLAAAYGIVAIWESVKGRHYRKAISYSLLTIIFAAWPYIQLVCARWAHLGPSLYEIRIEKYLVSAMQHEDAAEYEQALADLRLAGSIDPSNRRVLFRQAMVYYYVHDLASAQEAFKQVVAICPLCVDGYYNLGLIYNNEGRFREASVVLEKALALTPEEVAVHFELGRAYQAMNKQEAAREEFNFCLQHISRWRTQEREMILQALEGLSS